MIKINKSYNTYYLLLPLLTTLITSFFLGYRVISRGFKTNFIPLVIILVIQTIAIIIMHNKNSEKGLRIYIIGLYLGNIYSQINLQPYRSNDYVAFTIISIFLIVLTILIFSEPSNYIITFFNYIYICVKYALNSDYTVIKIVTYDVYIALIIIVFYVANRRINSLHNEKIQSLKITQKTTLQILGRVSEIKDSETDLHLKRVEIIIHELVSKLMNNKYYSNYISDKYLEDIQAAAYLHDIGKIGISDSIINKPGKLTKDEFDIMKSHTIIGYEIIKESQNNIENEDIFTLALEICRHHHEKWNGQGYPDGLSQTDIPLSARIMAVVDVYDALTSTRAYKKSFSHIEAITIIREDSGTHFDPLIAEIFLDHADEIYKKILSLHNDT